jgi:hypothetical protein
MRNAKTAGLAWVLAAGCLLFITGCVVPPARRPQPRDIYNQVPLRNWRMATTIYWYPQFTAADPNAEVEFSGNIAPQRLLRSLNNAGAADGNTFPQGTANQYDVFINVYEYSDHNNSDEHRSLRADVWALGHRDMCFSERTTSYNLDDSDSMIDDLGAKIYSWFHAGWNTH